MSIIGDYLTQERSNLGYSLDDIEAITKIRKHYLEALETGNFAALPPQVYATGFVKRLSQLFDLDADLNIAWFKHEAFGDPRPETDLPAIRSAEELQDVVKVSPLRTAPASFRSKPRSKKHLTTDKIKTVSEITVENSRIISKETTDSSPLPSKSVLPTKAPISSEKEDLAATFQLEIAPSTYKRRYRGSKLTSSESSKSFDSENKSAGVTSGPEKFAKKQEIPPPYKTYTPKSGHSSPYSRKSAGQKRNPFGLSSRNLLFSIIFLIVAIWLGNIIGQKLLDQSPSTDITDNLTLKTSPTQWKPPEPEPIEQPPAPPPPIEGVNLKISVKSNMSCWMEVTADDKIVFSDTVPGGNTKEFKAKKHIQVKVGNARAVSFELNGQPPEAFSNTPGVVTREFKIDS